MKLIVTSQYLFILVHIDMIFAQQEQKFYLDGTKLAQCGQQFDLGNDMEQYRALASDSSGTNPKEICLRLCIYQAMDLTDENFDVKISKFVALAKQAGHILDPDSYEGCLAKAESLKGQICEYQTSRVHCFISKPTIKF